jgi:peptide/nickel transport system substrate-binding protein
MACIAPSSALQRSVVLLCAWLGVHACLGCRADREVGGTGALVVLLPREAQELDPRYTGDAYGLKISRLLFASLLTIDSDSLQPVPDLAESVTLESPTRYRARLRSGLRFSDGSLLDSEDVAATFASVVDPAMATRYARTYDRIARVEMLDALTVVFHLKLPHATFMTDLELPILRAEDRRRHLATPGGPMPVGAGPYVLRKREAGRIELARNPRWHGGATAYEGVEMLVVRDDNTRALRLLAGAGDLALNAVPPLLLPLFERDPRFAVQRAPGVGTTYLGLNLDAPALRDVRVRRAIAHALDRRTIVDTKLGGRAQLARSWIVPGHWAFDPRTPSYAYDAAQARRLLSEAGWPKRAPRLSLRCGSDRFRQSIARVVASMLGEVGIPVDVRPSEVATLIADLNRGRFELTMLEVPEIVEPHTLTWFFGSDHVPSPGHEGANRWRLQSKELDAALEHGRASVEPPERAAAYGRVQRLLAELLPIVPLWHEDVVAVKGPRARKLTVTRLARFDLLVSRGSPRP